MERINPKKVVNSELYCSQDQRQHVPCPRRSTEAADGPDENQNEHRHEKGKLLLPSKPECSLTAKGADRK